MHRCVCVSVCVSVDVGVVVSVGGGVEVEVGVTGQRQKGVHIVRFWAQISRDRQGSRK